MPKEILGEVMYNIEEAADIIGVTPRTILNYIKQGRILGQKLGRRWYFSEERMKNFLQGTAPLPHTYKQP